MNELLILEQKGLKSLGNARISMRRPVCKHMRMEKSAIRIVYVAFLPITASDPLLTPTGFWSGKDGIAQGRGAPTPTAFFSYGGVDFAHTFAPMLFDLFP